ncbi:HesB/IscA family protein [Caldinitratiruptor microaerophilus]|uniref:Heme biosynthesis protein HemY n=1 Tax=Caldinitratiruptor microaerophilus TaxID=671077 RepID=A0AA35CNP5_9FIRM|nr:iron-sulfur cluster assembly accessory protein [Caldinitratiruptor microaerophilus]BDG60942.1 heme biosynthesis protein HemY [Caldinitratiruptor microaerophilus]
MVITLTERASGRLREIIAEKGELLAVRIAVTRSGCCGYAYHMSLDRSPRPGDEVVEQGGMRLLVDAESAELLDGAEIDFVEHPQGSGFAIHNPNVRSSCGCGGHGHH